MTSPDGPTGHVPAVGAKQEAVRAEQAHLERVHERVAVVRDRAQAEAEAQAGTVGGSTFQARFERDVQVHHHAARAARYTFGDVESLVFGRLDLSGGDRLHIGRVSVIDADGDVLLTDWRAAAAAAFYRATPVDRQSVVRRRTLHTRGRLVVDLDDEILDAEAADRLGLRAVTGQGALLAALERTRDGRMQDIVATIQADQDRIIREPARGVLILSGGPGTGKTVVALHRVAYLLYEDRERFTGRGILVVGPSPQFVAYTSRVLPALGEQHAVQRDVGQLGPPGVAISGWDRPLVGEVKGRAVMARVCRRLLLASLPPLPPSTRVTIDGVTVNVSADRLEHLRNRLLRTLHADQAAGRTLWSLRPDAERALRQHLWEAWRHAHVAAGRIAPDEGSRSAFVEMAAESASVTMLARAFWPVPSAPDVLMAVRRGDVDLAAVVGDLLEPREVDMVARAWRDAEAWTVDDAPLLDELAAMIGGDEAESQEADRQDHGLRLAADRFTLAPPVIDVEAPTYRDFAHVVVDEAQDLSPMQWRAVARRAPFASWTIVGDLDQRQRAGDALTWEEIGAMTGRRHTVRHRLTVNYRTPVEIARIGGAVRRAAGLPEEETSVVRSTGQLPGLVRAEDTVAAGLQRVDSAGHEHGGTIAVIAPESRISDLADALGAIDGEIAARTAVLSPRSAKGLEFDDVVVVDADVVWREPDTGPADLYVAVTRATRMLTIVVRPGGAFGGMEAFEEEHSPALVD